MKKEYSITVGICALNEEKTIRQVIEQVLTQEQEGWELKELRVYSDGSTDDTVQRARAVNDSRIVVISSNERKGKTFRLQQLFDEAQGEIIVMFDADISLVGKEVITRLVKSFTDRDVALVGGNSRPFKPVSFFEKAVYSTFRVFYESRLKMKNGHSIFGATGSIMAGRKTFLQSFRFPKIINEDAYIYMTCITQGFKFRYIDSAVIEYALPKNAKDYIKQVVRSEPSSVEMELKKYFGDTVQEEFYRPHMFYVTAIVKECVRNPIGVMYVILLNILSRWIAPFMLRNYKLEWFTAHSTH